MPTDGAPPTDAAPPTDGAVTVDGALPGDAAPHADGGSAPDAAPPECADGQAKDACGVCGGDGAATWYADVDRDGLGDPRIAVEACAQPANFVGNSDDAEPECATNDTDACGICAGPGELFWFADQDEDGRGDPDMRLVGCAPPRGFVANDDDAEPLCATNDTDVCGVCAGPGPRLFYPDGDGDGLGADAEAVEACEAPDGFVDNNDDPEPLCATNDTDACGRCGGPGRVEAWVDQDGDGLGDPAQRVEVCALEPGLVRNGDDPEPECRTNDTDVCGVCGGDDGGADCHGTCGGTARFDSCGRCVGGETGLEPAVADRDMDGIPDLCDDCPDRPVEQRVIIQWTEVPPFTQQGQPAHGPYTFQLVLWPTGEFTFLYEVVEPFGATNTVGYQFNAGDGQALGIDTEFVVDQRRVHWLLGENGLEVDYARQEPFVDIRDLGEDQQLGDDASSEFELPFPFPFGGATFDRIYISSNGFVSFTPIQGAAYQNGLLPDPQYGPSIFPFWDDLNPSAGGAVHAFVATPACEDDCNGDLGGFAYFDQCGVCVGGNTGQQPSEDVDCNGDCNGTAFVNGCGQCVGGNTGVDPEEAPECAPDLMVVEDYLANTLQIDYYNAQDPCLIQERCIGALGQRKLLRFGTRIANLGTADLQLGRPQQGVDHWIFDECHNHFHYEAYASYDLYDVAAGETLPIGAKAGFAVIDIGVHDPALAPNGCQGYNSQNQGISVGCQDTYSRSLNCQWVDITDVEDGIYELVVTTNPDRLIPELDYSNNAARVRIQLTGDTVQLVP
ncbi:MAG: hypothetical protein H6704_25725 [Myxococcales bacterium]|nr:hypothetical protein [Myxococcales bacterium]